MQMCTKLLLVDDHKLFRQGLRRILELESDLKVVGEAGDAEEALQVLQATAVDVVLMDINMPGCNGVEGTRRIKARYPEVAILVLTIHDDTEYLIEVVRAGAVGYLLKDVEPDHLIAAIHTVAAGGPIVNPGLGNQLIKNLLVYPKIPVETPAAHQNILSSREQEVLHIMAQGCTTEKLPSNCLSAKKRSKIMSATFCANLMSTTARRR